MELEKILGIFMLLLTIGVPLVLIKIQETQILLSVLIIMPVMVFCAWVLLKPQKIQ